MRKLLEQLSNSWTVFYVLGLGIVLLMISARPELQARPGREQAPAENIELAGQILTWTTSTVLGYRMVRGTREYIRSGRSQSGA